MTYLDLMVFSDFHTVEEKVVEALQMKVMASLVAEVKKVMVICLVEKAMLMVQVVVVGMMVAR
uniref:Uncharacterized protein n=1 Tax=Solanum tuberosum TaxID=4113 RepID=M1A5K7_SOLTU